MASEIPSLANLLRFADLGLGRIETFCDICGMLVNLNDVREVAVLDYASKEAWRTRSDPKQLFILACTLCYTMRPIVETVEGRAYPPTTPGTNNPC